MSSLTQKWLRQTAQAYSNSERVYSDIDLVLGHFSTLRPKSDVYTFDDGRTQLLLCLHGLLPIQFRASSYNIPIAVWIPLDYPRDPPIPYVVPTNDMLVKPGRFVDVSGRCNIEYIQHWARKHEACSLLPLFQAFQDHFSREPPLYAKPSPALPPARPAKPLSLAQHTAPPPPPPPPPLPPHPYRPSPTYSSVPAQVPPPLAPLFPLAPPPAPPPPPPPPPPPVFPLHPVPPHPDLLDQDNPSDTLPSAHPSPFAAPPPRPPNPELVRLHSQVHQKLSSELDSLTHAIALDAERLRAHQADLLAAEPAIKDEMARLEAVRDVCLNVAQRTRHAVQQADSNIADLRKKGDPEVDELVCAPTIVHNQLINLIADDNAVEDTIYHLHRALNAGRIDLERFLRSTRLLAEEQFMKRALIEKIQTNMPLSASAISPDWN